jgi:hypothetical protein
VFERLGVKATGLLFLKAVSKLGMKFLSVLFVVMTASFFKRALEAFSSTRLSEGSSSGVKLKMSPI